MVIRCLWLALGAALASAVPAQAATWPPPSDAGVLFVHFGEEHLDDDDGARIFPKVVADSIQFRPNAVITSADKSSDGTVENLQAWKQVMGGFDRAGIPFFAGVGNHDRKAPPGVPGGLSPVADLGNYMDVFADRPYPFGDAAPYGDPLLAPQARPASDPAGASSHYSFDYANVRWIILDNSCFSIINCDPLQNPPFPDAEGNSGQYEFLARRTAEAKARGMKVFVSFHMPTQDPRPGHTEPTPSAHTMGEGTSPDNQLFEAAAASAGVDGVFAGHIKGQWIYSAQGVPYFTDGGAGGEVYVGPAEEVGVDSGYWHGYRLVRVLGDGRVTTDAVPVFVEGGITVSGPASVRVGSTARFAATGEQPTEEGPEVEALELRDPDPARSNAANLPSPARIWTSANPLVLAPVAAPGDDPRRDPVSQTDSGVFRGACPGKTSVEIASGVESRAAAVTVASLPGRIVQRVRRGPRRIRRGRRATVVRLALRQRAETLVRIRRRGRVVRTLTHACLRHGNVAVSWDARVRRGGRLRPARPGLYKVEVLVRSDRRPVRRFYRLRVVAAQRARRPRRPVRRLVPRVPAFTGRIRAEDRARQFGSAGRP